MYKSCVLAQFLLLSACDDNKDAADDTSSVASSGDDTGATSLTGFPVRSCTDIEGTCHEIEGGDNQGLLETVNLLVDDTTIILGEGTWNLDNQVTIRSAQNIHFLGQGMNETILDFADQAVQTNGVDSVGDGFIIEGLTIRDAKKDGLRIEDSDGVVVRDVKITWSRGPHTENGAYGIYPVRSSNVLVENCEAWNSSDAGLYIGQSQHVIIRNNYAAGNVAGIEVENTQYADVYGNVAEGNTGGLLVFDLPGNPIVGRDIKVHDNIVRDNNIENFAPGGTVAQVPAGTGMVILASRRVEATNNTFENNNSVDIAIINGLAIEGNEELWGLDPESVVGNWEDLGLQADDEKVYNYRTDNVVISGNTHSGSGTNVDINSLDGRPIGYLIGAIYRDESVNVDSVVYGTIGESSFSATDAAENSNDNAICVGDNTNGTFASLDLEAQAAAMEAGAFPTHEDVFRPAAPFAPFDCTELTAGAIGDITISVE